MEDEKRNVAEEDLITLEFDDGSMKECEIMGIFDHDGKDYIALIPQDETDDVYIYGYKELKNDEFELFDIKDDDLFNDVVKEFDYIMGEDE